MISARALLAGAVLLVCLGCTRQLGDPPSVDNVDPASSPSVSPTLVHVKGAHFALRLYVDFGTPSKSGAQGSFSARLVRDGAVTPLEDVTFVSATELTAVVPAGVPEGSYTLEVTDPWDRTASKADAFVVCPANCDDGLACTRDSCDGAGACTHDLAPDQCLIGGACHAQGEALSTNTCQVCDPASSPTDWTYKGEGQACDDGNACTSGEHCVSGACGSPTDTVTCGPGADGGCTVPTCNPANGQCEPVPLADGTPCDDSSACTAGERCFSGQCGRPTAVVTCPTRSPCEIAGSCDPATGRCGAPQAIPDGGTCDDGYSCTSNDTCVAGTCRGTANGSCANTPPKACLVAEPQGGLKGDTFTFDASCSSDLEDAPSALKFRFDFQGSGTFTAFSNTPSATFTYPTAGTYSATVEVQDSSGVSAFATRLVVVANTSDDVLVTTAADEADPGATPSSPGGTGFSLREAIQYVNTTNNAHTIRFAQGMTVLAKALPALSANGATIAGRPDVVLDFSPAAADGGTVTACLVLSGSNDRIVGVEAVHCPGVTVQTQGTGAQIADSNLHEGALGMNGVELGGTSGTLGPRTQVYGFSGTGVLLRASGNTLDGVRVYQNATGVDYASASISNITVQRSEIFSNAGAGLAIASSPTTLTARFNTIDGNGGAGINPQNSTTGVTARNNLLARNGGAGLCGPAGAYANREPNGFFANDGGTFCSGSPDAGSLLADPMYLAPSQGDFRLAPGSPAINAGVDLGLDVNGPAAGNFNGANPDLGANEAP